MAKKKKSIMKQWLVPMLITRRCRVVVEAETAEEAREKAKKGEFDDDGYSSEEIDWELADDPIEENV